MRIFLILIFIISSDYLSAQQPVSATELNAGVQETELVSENAANDIIRKAIENKAENDPQQALEKFLFSSYQKIFIDNEEQKQEEFANRGRNFLSEIVSTHIFEAPNVYQEQIIGMNTAGFDEPVYEVVELDLHPRSIYQNDLQILETRYASPLADHAFKNYSFQLLDTLTNATRPAYLVSFKPKREKLVPGIEGVLKLDTATFAVQKLTGQLSGALELEIEHNFEYFEEEGIWFPSDKTTILKPGTGEVDISVFGGSISLGAVQRKGSILDILLVPGEVEEDLYLYSKTTNFDVSLNKSVEREIPSATINVTDGADERSVNFWANRRKEPFTIEDELTDLKVRRILHIQNVEQKLEISRAISNGSFPVGFWDFELSRFINYNKHEGLRVGVGGNTNDRFSERIRLDGYVNYGFRDEAFKYSAGLGTLLNKRTGTWFHLNYTKDIREVGSFDYLREVVQFSLFEPRIANISFFYNFRNLQSSVRHRISPHIETELAVARNDISQIGDYAFLHNNKVLRDYTIGEAKFGILWSPFSEFLNTPSGNTILKRDYPEFTAQISKSIPDFLGGDLGFTRLGVKIEYQVNRLDLSSTQFTLEGSRGFGDLPLTHGFHSDPNNLNEPAILDRFSVAGKTAFETMYFNEFFSDQQLALHAKHRFPPLRITRSFRPEIVLISRHAIGDFDNIQAHQNIEFNRMNHGFSEAGLEINQIFFGFGLSFAYRYGAYHLPRFEENISFKFTFDLTI